MATHFDRSAIQEFFEWRMGCVFPEQFQDHVDRLSCHRLTLDDEIALFDRVKLDIQGQYERSVLSLFQAILDIESGNRLWAIVKLYYSVFYALRVELHLQGMSVIRCNKIFFTDRKLGSFLKRYNNSEKGDHGIAISLSEKFLSDTDILLSASIDQDKNVYRWLKRQREIIQYKMRNPPEAVGYDPFFPDHYISIHEQIKIFLADNDPYYCFDPDYAALAIPIKRFQITSNNIAQEKIDFGAEFKQIIISAYEKSNSLKLLKPYLVI